MTMEKYCFIAFIKTIEAKVCTIKSSLQMLSSKGHGQWLRNPSTMSAPHLCLYAVVQWAGMLRIPDYIVSFHHFALLIETCDWRSTLHNGHPPNSAIIILSAEIRLL